MGYDKAHKTISAPLNTHSVARCLRAYSLDDATLCQSKALINPRSAKKPVRYTYNDNGEAIEFDNHHRELTDAEYAKVNYGIRINTSYSSLEECVAAIKNAFANIKDDENATKAFYYEAPKDGDMCRLTDFDGYKHNASNWVELYFDNHGNTDASDEQNATKLRVFFNEALLNIADIQRWGVASEFFDGVGNFIGTFAIVVCDANLQATHLVTLLSGEGLNQVDDNPIITFKPSIAGTFKVYPIIVKGLNVADGTAIEANTLKELTDVKFLPYPFASFTDWNPVESGTPEGGATSVTEAFTFAFDTKEGNGYEVQRLDSNDYWWVVRSFYFVITPINQSKDAVVSYEVFVGTDKKNLRQLASGYVDVPSNDVASVHYELSGKDNENDYRVYIEEGNPYLRVVYTSVGYRKDEVVFELI